MYMCNMYNDDNETGVVIMANNGKLPNRCLQSHLNWVKCVNNDTLNNVSDIWSQEHMIESLKWRCS